jgi:hypothetical protein
MRLGRVNVNITGHLAHKLHLAHLTAIFVAEGLHSPHKLIIQDEVRNKKGAQHLSNCPKLSGPMTKR